MSIQVQPEHFPRNRHAAANVTLETCHAITFEFENGRSVNVWKDAPKRTWPEDRSKRIRDVRPGDYVVSLGKREKCFITATSSSTTGDTVRP